MSKSKIQLHDIKIENNKVIYDYSYSPDLKIYFKNKDNLFITYDFDVSVVPKSILAIPWLANFITISWFTGSTIIIDEIDEDFVECLKVLKKAFAETHIEILNKKSDLIVNKSIKNNYPTHKEAMLFSGGLDSWTTFLKHNDKKLDLITIQGSDIELGNSNKMELIRKSFEENILLADLPLHFITCNFRDFYNRHIEKLIYYNYADWWTIIQHGIVLTASTAPLAYYYGYSNVFIASSFSKKDNRFSGSSELDNYVKFGNTTITHDGQEFNRFQKTEFVVERHEKLNTFIPLRVCYKHNVSSLNCGMCPKCLRMILSLILKNKNPNDFAFNVDASLYNTIITLLKEVPFRSAEPVFWSEIDAKISGNFDFYVFENKEREREKIFQISSIVKEKTVNYPSMKYKIMNFKNKIRNKLLKWKANNIS